MILFKNSASTMEGVLVNQKHATMNNLQFKKGSLILIQQTVNSLAYKKQKTIRWVMEYIRTYEDIENESDAIWGRHWNYIIEGKNLRPVEAFNIWDIQKSNFDYKSPVTHAYVRPMDEKVVMEWIGETEFIEGENHDLAIEFKNGANRDINAILEELNRRYSERPNYKKRVSSYVNRPSLLRDIILERDGTKCRICKTEGFVKKNGDKYCEVHHMVELNKRAPNTLQSWNVLVVCPTCHRKLHFGKVTSKFLNPGWKITIDNNTHIIN